MGRIVGRVVEPKKEITAPVAETKAPKAVKKPKQIKQ